MAIVRLKRPGAGDDQDVVVPSGKTVVGRGPFLRCSDKKVSRQHAQLDLDEDGSLHLTALHINPSFFLLSTGGGWQKLLSTDGKRRLDHGDRFSLSPDLSSYLVHIDYDDLEIDSNDRIPHLSEASRTPESTKTGEIKPAIVSIADTGSSSEKPESTRRPRTLPSWLVDLAGDSHSPASTSAGSTSNAKGGSKKTATPTKGKARSKEQVEPSPAMSSKVTAGSSRIDPAVEEKVGERVDECGVITAVEDRTTTPKKIPINARSRQSALVSDSSSDDEAITKAGGGVANSSPKKEDRLEKIVDRPKVESTPRLKATMISDSESDDDRPNTGPAKQTATPAKVDEPKNRPQNNGAASSTKGGRKRTSCPYGAKCIRKNPVHFQECCHPGDDDYNSDRDEQSDEERPECEYGTDCYRKNPQHLRDFKHTARPKRAAAKAAKRRAAEMGDDSEDGSYDDSFIDDSDEDKDYAPDRDDLELLKKEAKDFAKNKKMYKLN